MKCSTLFQAFLGLALFASSASATSVYNFDSTALGFRFEYLDLDPNNNDSIGGFSFSIPGNADNTVIYDEATRTASVHIFGTGTANGITTDYDFLVDFLNVIPIVNPVGLLGFSGTGASSDGTLTIANIGDITGDGVADTATLDLSAKFMNFAGDTGPLYGEISNLGSANFFLWNSIFYGSIASKAWFGTDNLYVNGVLRNDIFASITGDMHLQGGTQNTEVPEPASMLLLGMGAIGGAIRRRKSAF